MASRQFKVAIASFKWRSPLQSGESPVQSGDRQFKVANRQFKWRSPVQSGESLVQSSDRQFKVANRQFKNVIIPWPLMGTVEKGGLLKTYSLEQSFKGQSLLILTNRSRVWPLHHLNHGGDLDAMMQLTPAITRSAAYWRVQSGGRQFKVANRQFKVAIASSK